MNTSKLAICTGKNAGFGLAINLLVSFLLFASSNIPVQARNYHVDASGGDDSNPGTIISPWKSLGKVSTVDISPGDNIYLKRGEVWRENLILSNSGTADHPIMLGAYTDPDSPSTMPPVISCARNITNILWQGILANGGFNDIGTKADRVYKLCTCPATENTAKKSCARVKDTFLGWYSRGSGKITVTQDTTINTDKTEGPKGPAAKLESSNNFINLTSNAFTLRQHDTEDNKARYILSGYIKASPGSRVDVALYITGKEKYYLDNSGNWIAWTVENPRTPFIHTKDNSSWEYFEVPFSPRITGIHGKPINIDSGNTRITISVRGKGHVTGWVDDIRLIDRSRDYWTANTIYRHNPEILIENGVRLAKGTTEWDPDHKWHAGNQRIIRYIPDTPFTSEKPVVEIGQRTAGIKLAGAQYITIKDIVVSGCEKSHTSSACDGAALHIGFGSSNNTFMNITLTNNDYGLRVEGRGPKGENRNNLFSGIIADNNRSSGIALRNHATGNVIRSCRVGNTGMLDSDSKGQDIEPVSLGGGTGLGPDNIVEGCEIYNSRTKGKKPAAGIIAFNSPRTTIRNNYLHNIGRSGIILAAGSDNSVIHHNIINGTGTSPESIVGPGIDVSANGADISGVKIYNNTIFNCTNNSRIFGGITLRGKRKCQTKECSQASDELYKVRDASVINNIVQGCYGKYPIAYYASHVDFSSLISDHNLFYRENKIPGGAFILFSGDEYSNFPSKYTVWHSVSDFRNDRKNRANLFDQNSLEVDPKLVDPENANFQPGEDSPVIRAGKNIKTVIGTQQKVNSPNIGAM